MAVYIRSWPRQILLARDFTENFLEEKWICGNVKIDRMTSEASSINIDLKYLNDIRLIRILIRFAVTRRCTGNDHDF